jgi:hypothetical protein
MSKESVCNKMTSIKMKCGVNDDDDDFFRHILSRKAGINRDEGDADF